ncbi:MAG: hypothetical protein HY746_09555 [Elusimicrobia bacterium]|nr:hypothetical protein [Elusimicrobiota bacterium]
MEKTRIIKLFSLITLHSTLYTLPLLYANLFQESVKYYEAGDYKKAMMGFMDVVLKEPVNAAAGDYLRRSGAELLKKEESLARQQSRRFLEEASGVKSKMDDFRKAKAKRLKTWHKLLETAKKFASDHDAIREAVLAYENFLKNTPIYSDGYPEFQDALKELKKAFYKTIKDKYPYLIGNKDTVDERDLATLFFARESIDDFSYRYVYSNQTQAVLDKATKIRMLEEEISRVYSSAQRALEIYSFGRHQDSIDLWKEVLNFDHTNEEAYMYLDFAKSHTLYKSQVASHKSQVTDREQGSELPPEEKGVVVADVDTVRKSRAVKSGDFPAPSLKARKKIVPRNKSQVRGQRTEVRGQKSEVAAGLPSRNVGAQFIESAEANVAAVPAYAGTALSKDVVAELALYAQIKEAEKLYEKGVLEFSLGNMENAAGYWEECLKLNPKHLKAKVGIERIKR